MNPGSSTESYPAFAHIGLKENPGKNLNQIVKTGDRVGHNPIVITRQRNLLPDETGLLFITGLFYALKRFIYRKYLCLQVIISLVSMKAALLPLLRYRKSVAKNRLHLPLSELRPVSEMLLPLIMMDELNAVEVATQQCLHNSYYSYYATMDHLYVTSISQVNLVFCGLRTVIFVCKALFCIRTRNGPERTGTAFQFVNFRNISIPSRESFAHTLLRRFSRIRLTLKKAENSTMWSVVVKRIQDPAYRLPKDDACRLQGTCSVYYIVNIDFLLNRQSSIPVNIERCLKCTKVKIQQ
ncbi:hypothetical protein ANN_23565 [Periplaneta americana]|uniref:Uncharacterized protein n=1 Tax=Periplaneta americana TaxID=6978 RepID=A0ABQ8SLW3_PERAM|nr:hypothetical protein ANN_23565 [Periplaneta americana]